MAGTDDHELAGGKRQRDASAADVEDEPQVRRARSQEEPEAWSAEVAPSSSWPLNHEHSLEGQIDSMLKKDSKMAAEARTIAPRLQDYCAPGGTKKYLPRPEWFRPWLGRKRLRENDTEQAERAENEGILAALLAGPVPPELAARLENETGYRVEDVIAGLQADLAPPGLAAQQVPPAQQEPPSHVDAPADGLLPEHAFAEFQQPPQPPPQVPDAPAETVPQPPPEPAASSQSAPPRPEQQQSEMRLATFGRDCDSALHVAIRENATEAALALLAVGASVHVENVKGVTPLILASQRGNLQLVKELHTRGASVHKASHTGSTPLIQAAHFGHLSICEYLLERGASLEIANLHNTTPLMRAAQEGHYDIVKLLVERGAQVNRRNTEHMTALMLASQRGHADIVELLVEADAEVDATTNQDSTSLMLACKRGNANVVRVLVTAGCELWIRDSRGRTAKDMAVRRNAKELVKLLDPDLQVDLMRRKSRTKRNYAMVEMWTLLQQERAHVPLSVLPLSNADSDVSIHRVNEELIVDMGSFSALVRTMALPAPLLEHVAGFLPLPHLWDQRMSLITKQCTVDPDAAIAASLDVIDEALDEGGFIHACDEAAVTPPTGFSSWREWKAVGCQYKEEESKPAETSTTRQNVTAVRPNVTEATLPGLPRFEQSPAATAPEKPKASLVEMRRGMCFLQLLAHRTPMLGRILSMPPYNMPVYLIQRLITVSDVQSLSRRMGSNGVHFEATVAIELVMLANSICSWCDFHRRFVF